MFDQSSKSKTLWLMVTVIVPIAVAVIGAVGVNVIDWLFPAPAPAINSAESSDLKERVVKLENEVGVLVSLLREHITKPVTKPVIRIDPRPVPVPTEDDKREVEVKNSSVYLGRKLYVGQRAWEWTIYVSAEDRVLNKISCVTYTLHPTFPDPVNKVCVMGDREKAFHHTRRGWGTFTIKVLITFNDGFELSKSHQLVFVPGD